MEELNEIQKKIWRSWEAMEEDAFDIAGQKLMAQAGNCAYPSEYAEKRWNLIPEDVRKRATLDAWNAYI